MVVVHVTLMAVEAVHVYFLHQVDVSTRANSLGTII